MKVEDFDYDLPKELIAQTPLEKRDDSRLLVVDRASGHLSDEKFHDIARAFGPDDVLVLNDTKVLPSRIRGKKEDTGAEIEILLLRDLGHDEWEALARPARRVHQGTVLDFSSLFKGTITSVMADGIVHIRFTYEGIFIEHLAELGKMPLPPYIHEELKDQDRYQTVYAKELGSAAAPTAGLHFTPELLDEIRARGTKTLFVTLHVGLGTFRPVMVDAVEDHVMHSEYYHISPSVAADLNQAKAEGKRIVAVGTTSTRTLEANMTKYGRFTATTEATDIFIYPGYTFKAIDRLITNFHLPKSTLVMLVSAFYSREGILDAYAHAVKEKYRFFSFGDAMFLI